VVTVLDHVGGVAGTTEIGAPSVRPLPSNTVEVVVGHASSATAEHGAGGSDGPFGNSTPGSNKCPPHSQNPDWEAPHPDRRSHLQIGSATGSCW
jgi:hypothetical protein